MKDSPDVKEILYTDENVNALPEVIAEWNMNRYLQPKVDNTPSDDTNGYHPEYFPIESIIEPLRPNKGVCKARVGQGTLGSAYTSNQPWQQGPRFYLPSPDDQYRYWTSPEKSASRAGTFDTSPKAIANVKPHVIYTYNTGTTEAPVYEGAWINKIVIKTENTWATMSTFQVQIARDPNPSVDDDWETVGNENDVTNDFLITGNLTLWSDGLNWHATKPTTAAPAGNPHRIQEVHGIRLVVTSLRGGFLDYANDGAPIPTQYLSFNRFNNSGYEWITTAGDSSYFDLIEISGRLECDITPYVISTSDQFEVSDTSNLYPVGRMTSNQASITLSNIWTDAVGEDYIGAFSKFNELPIGSDDFKILPWNQFLEPNIKVNLAFKYFDDNWELIDTVQQFSMYVDDWAGQSNEEVQVTLSDYSKFLDVTKPQPMMVEDATLGGCVARVLDSIGFTSYFIHADNKDISDHTIPVFWTDGEKSVMEVLDELAVAMQASISFDGYGMLHVRAREYIYSPTRTPDLYISSESKTLSGGIEALSNIVDLNGDTQFEPNKYKISYKATKWTPDNNGSPTMTQVWQPEESTVVLRSNALTYNMNATQKYFAIDAKSATTWPYSGIVNIEGELMSFDAKLYVYWTGSTGATKNTAWVKNNDELNKYKELTPAQHQYKNYINGSIRVVERGLWNSNPKAHTIDASGYTYSAVTTSSRKLPAPGFKHLKTQSKIQMLSPSWAKDYRYISMAHRGGAADTPFEYYGTRVSFAKGAGRTHQRGGINVYSTGWSDGYFFEITPTIRLGKEYKTRGEVIIYARKGGKNVSIRSARAAIVEGVEYEIDVFVNEDSIGNHRLQMWLNGKQMISVTLPPAHKAHVTKSGKFGLFIAGKTDMRSEYLYGVTREGPVPREDITFLNKVDRGYTSDQLDREWVYEWKTRTRRVKKKTTKQQYRYNRFFFDEFGPIVHEVRKFDVKFDPGPCMHSRLYMTNDWGAICLEYSPTPFGASFYLANTSRKNSVVHGEDTLSYAGSNSSINQVLTVYGRSLIIADAQEVEAVNDAQVKARGEHLSELTSDWIQNKEMAEDIANWMKNNWSYGNESFNIEIFGNPLIEVGDVVHVEFPSRGIVMDAFVNSVNTAFDSGISTTINVRRRIS